MRGCSVLKTSPQEAELAWSQWLRQFTAIWLVVFGQCLGFQSRLGLGWF